jgi:folate-binding protein YgfZ
VAWIEPLSDEAWGRLDQGVAWFVPEGSASLRLTGADRLPFLNGQVTQDTRRLNAGERLEALMLNVKGQTQAHMDLHARDNDVHVWVHGGRQPFVLHELKRHVVFDDVTVSDLSDGLVHVVVTGRNTADWLQSTFDMRIPSRDRFETVGALDATLLIASFDRSPYPAVSVAMLAKDANRVLEGLGLNASEALPSHAGDVLALAAGWPSVSDGAGVGQLPQVLRLDPLVNPTKGCYLGQEVMARLDARASLKRFLYAFEQDRPATNDSDSLIDASGGTVGRVWQSTTRDPRPTRFGLALCDAGAPNADNLTLGGAPVTLHEPTLIGRSDAPVH